MASKYCTQKAKREGRPVAEVEAEAHAAWLKSSGAKLTKPKAEKKAEKDEKPEKDTK